MGDVLDRIVASSLTITRFVTDFWNSTCETQTPFSLSRVCTISFMRVPNKFLQQLMV